MNDELFSISRLCLEKLAECQKRISFAESCTGGLIAKAITDHSGASDVFECGIVSYSGRIKNLLLSVPTDLISAYGEVSREVAEAMARGVACVSGADIGVGVTGIAGPTGATTNKKVGLIYVGISVDGKVESHKLELYDEALSRTQRREQTACFVYRQIIEILK